MVGDLFGWINGDDEQHGEGWWPGNAALTMPRHTKRDPGAYLDFLTKRVVLKYGSLGGEARNHGDKAASLSKPVEEANVVSVA